MLFSFSEMVVEVVYSVVPDVVVDSSFPSVDVVELVELDTRADVV